MSFLYPRTITITRPVEQTTGSGIGLQNYSAPLASQEVAVIANVPASIQSSRERGRPLGQTPSDAPDRSQWNIYTPGGTFVAGLVRDRDIATDDLGRRFEIVAADPGSSLGYRMRAELLEA